MDKMLELGAITTLEPLSSFSPARVHEVLDLARLESVEEGRDVLGAVDLEQQSVYLVKGELELRYQDNNRLLVCAGSEWAKYPLGKRQPHVLVAAARSEVRLLCINDDVLRVIAARNDAPGSAAERARGLAHLGSSSVVSANYLKFWPFTRLPAERRERLQELVEAVVAWENEAVICENDPADYYYVIEKGAAQVSRFVGGVDMVLAHLTAGDAFGEEALVSGARRNATVTMKSNGVLLRFKREAFFELVQAPLLRYLSFAEASRAVEDGAVWIDVRYPPEFRRDKLPGAINVPLNDVRNAIVALDRGRRYIAYCEDGKRSAVAAFILARAGFEIGVLEGGLHAAV
jgi:rhodanese-related sulfurtransferase